MIEIPVNVFVCRPLQEPVRTTATRVVSTLIQQAAARVAANGEFPFFFHRLNVL
jgi:hypothetical protein